MISSPAPALLAFILSAAPLFSLSAYAETSAETSEHEVFDEIQAADSPTQSAVDATEAGDQASAGISDEELEALTRALEADQSAATGAGAGAEDEVGADAMALRAPRARNAMAALASALNPEISLILDVSAAYFSDTPMQLGAHDPHRTGFNFNQLELALAANVDPYFLFRANLVFGQFGVELEEAYAQTTSLPGRIQIRAGQFLNRIGRLNPTHPHSWNFLDQPLVNGKFLGGEGNRGIGAEFSWLAPTPFYLELIGAAMHPEGDCCARSFDGGAHPGIGNFGDFLYLVAAKSLFAFGPSWSLSWGLSGLMGPNMTGAGNRSEIWATDLYLRFKPVTSTNYTAFSLQAEIMHRRRQVPDDVLVDNGFYAQAVWNINRRWETGLRYELVTGVEGDYLDTEWSSNRHRLSVQGTLYPSHFSRVRVQLNYDNPTWRDRPIWAAFLGLEFNVGPHGAHTF